MLGVSCVVNRCQRGEAVAPRVWSARAQLWRLELLGGAR